MTLLYDQNLAKISELQLSKQWAAKAWLNDCFNANLTFKILEAFRSQHQQDIDFTAGRPLEELKALYAKGAITQAEFMRLTVLYETGQNRLDNVPGAVVTQTLHSMHTQGLALDLHYINCTCTDLLPFAVKYRIIHPFMWDPPHWEFNYVGPEPLPEPVIQPTPEAHLRGLERRLAGTTDAAGRQVLLNSISRLKARLS